ncbi:hypothetical protein AMECASPLE_024740 [Ameca splendens]|uniref:Uncharacterized protein n=1 Tax=Ameca splendens TaxID=208324 RepID=A0ABV0Y4I0_9TELE
MVVLFSDRGHLVDRKVHIHLCLLKHSCVSKLYITASTHSQLAKCRLEFLPQLLLTCLSTMVVFLVTHQGYEDASSSGFTRTINMFVLIKIFYLPSCCLSVCIPGSSATQAVTSSKEHVYCR